MKVRVSLGAAEFRLEIFELFRDYLSKRGSGAVSSSIIKFYFASPDGSLLLLTSKPETLIMSLRQSLIFIFREFYASL